MNIRFEGKTENVMDGIRLLRKELGFELGAGGIPVRVEQRPGNIEVVMKDGKGLIGYQEKIHFFRALGLFCEKLASQRSFSITEEPQFDMNGVMADVSRNAALKPDSIKIILNRMALMGLNMIMLYAEDTYEIPNRPYFGYMRGRYSFDELKECDDYADKFGIEIIPCIQTLAHLEQAIKWSFADEMKDTSDILLVGNAKTYEFVEDMIKAASAPFRSKRIHLGMDEALLLGLGKYLDTNGYRRRHDIMSEHLSRVREITAKYGLEPMIWSDMYFRLGSKTGDYYDPDAEIPEDVIGEIPEDLGLVYWDYYHNDEAMYKRFIRLHKGFKRDVIFAGGIWTWNGISVNYGKTFTATNAALSACKKEGVRKVFATMWGDNGAETNFFSSLLGMQLYAEHGYSKELDEEKLKARFEFCVKAKYDSFIELSGLDRIPGNDYEIANPSKFLLWQDVLIGLFDRHIEGKAIDEYYSGLEKKIAACAAEAGEWKFVFDMPRKLCSVLSLKSGMGQELKTAYDGKDKTALRVIAQEKLKELYGRVNELRVAHREQWMGTYKAFGWEIIDIRYGGLLARIESASARVMDYISGKTDKIEELEEERLYFGSFGMGDSGELKSCNQYSRIISASPIG